MKNQRSQDWIDAATDDLNLARLALENGYGSHVCFLSQQTAEKSLKSLFLMEGKVYPRTHKLIELLASLGDSAKEVKLLETELEILDEYYLPMRYPDAIPGTRAEGLPEADDAKTAIETAEKVLELVKKISES
jgi:HEPN domain-containing protein